MQALRRMSMVIVLALTACGGARPAVRIIGHAAVEIAAPKVERKVDNLTDTMKSRVQSAAKSATRSLDHFAQHEIAVALSKVERGLDVEADELMDAVAGAMTEQLDRIAVQTEKVSLASVDETSATLRAQIQNLAAQRRAAEIAAGELALSYREQADLDGARTSAARDARVAFDADIQAARAERDTCEQRIVVGDAEPGTSCGTAYVNAVALARELQRGKIDAAVTAHGSELAAMRPANRAELEEQASAHARAFEADHAIEIDARVVAMREQARLHVQRMVQDARGDLKSAVERLRGKLLEQLRVALQRGVTLDDGDITRLVNESLDGFVTAFSDRVKTTLKAEMNSAVDKMVDLLVP